MTHRLAALLLLCLTAYARGIVPAAAAAGDDPQTLPAGITCCDEQKIRQAMSEEALQRIAARSEGGSWVNSDYLSDLAYEKIRRRLPAASRERVMDFLRAALQQPPPDEDTRQFQLQVGHFVLGMTLEIGLTFQDEFDLALGSSEKVGTLLAELEKSPALTDETLGRALFRADIPEKELRRLKLLGRKWKSAPAAAPPFLEFNILKGNVTGRAADPDQQTVFDLAARYRDRFPFLDEFLDNYRRLAAEFREAVIRLNERLAYSEPAIGEK